MPGLIAKGHPWFCAKIVKNLAKVREIILHVCHGC
jgi:hypothetical protein